MPKSRNTSDAASWINLGALLCAFFIFASASFAGNTGYRKSGESVCGARMLKEFFCRTGEHPEALQLRNESLVNSGVHETDDGDTVIMDYRHHLELSLPDKTMTSCLKDKEDVDAEILIRMCPDFEELEDTVESSEPSASDESFFRWFTRNLAKLFRKPDSDDELASGLDDDDPDEPFPPYTPLSRRALENIFAHDLQKNDDSVKNMVHAWRRFFFHSTQKAQSSNSRRPLSR